MCVEGGAGGGGLWWVFENRPSHHKYKSPKQFNQNQVINRVKTTGLI